MELGAADASGKSEGIRWQVSSGRTAAFHGGPDADASGDPDGGYALVEVSRAVAGAGRESAAISGVVGDATPARGRCVFFR